MIGQTEVFQDPEIHKIYNKIKQVEEQVTDLDKIVAPNNTKLQKLAKITKALLDNEIARKL